MNGIELVNLIFLSLCLWRAFLKLAKNQNEVLVLWNRVCDFQMSLGIEEGKWDDRGLAREDENYLLAMIREAYFRGESIRFPLQKIANQLLKEYAHQVYKQHLLSLLLTRIFVVSLFSVLARLFVSCIFPIRGIYVYDWIALLLATFLAMGLFLSVQRFFPKSWFWEGAFQKEAKDWIQSLFLAELSPRSPIYEYWLKVMSKEFESGISLLPNKKRLLSSWASIKEIEMQRSRTFFEDYLPVAEFLGLGLSAFLILAVPFWHLIKD